MFRHQQTCSRPASTVGLARELTMAVLSAEGVATPGPFHLKNTAAFIHRMNPHAVHTAAIDSARTVRVQVIKPPAALNPCGLKATHHSGHRDCGHPGADNAG